MCRLWRHTRELRYWRRYRLQQWIGYRVPELRHDGRPAFLIDVNDSNWGRDGGAAWFYFVASLVGGRAKSRPLRSKPTRRKIYAYPSEATPASTPAPTPASTPPPHFALHLALPLVDCQGIRNTIANSTTQSSTTGSSSTTLNNTRIEGRPPKPCWGENSGSYSHVRLLLCHSSAKSDVCASSDACADTCSDS